MFVVAGRPAHHRGGLASLIGLPLASYGGLELFNVHERLLRVDLTTRAGFPFDNEDTELPTRLTDPIFSRCNSLILDIHTLPTAMLYEMIAVVSSTSWALASDIHSVINHSQVRPGSIQEVKDLALSASLAILRSGGVVRSLTNWGPFLLTRPFRKHKTKYDTGHHFILRFDCAPEVQRQVRKATAIDPRMIRCGVVRIGKQGTLAEICGVEGGRVGMAGQKSRLVPLEK